MQSTPAGLTAKPNTRKHFSHRNKTIVLSAEEKGKFRRQLLFLNSRQSLEAVSGSIINQELEEAAPFLPSGCVNLLIVDPPYNLNKTYNKTSFRRMSLHDYEMTLEKWLTSLIHTLAPNATVYICGDWQSSPAVYNVASRHLKIRNRITWEREKGRGAKNNWKNCSEDIWFCTLSGNYTFHADRVKLTRKVIAPYRDADGLPRDWIENGAGKIRLTYPSNLWSDISIPFWSMAENTEHPTQKPEKLIAKLILASSNENDVVFDPFLGSGTTAVVSAKLQRRFFGIEKEQDYCCVALKRLELAQANPTIQGYGKGVFWERNTLPPSGNNASTLSTLPLMAERT